MKLVSNAPGAVALTTPTDRVWSFEDIVAKMDAMAPAPTKRALQKEGSMIDTFDIIFIVIAVFVSTVAALIAQARYAIDVALSASSTK